MTQPVELLSRYDPSHENEGSVHLVMREGQTALLWTVRILLVVTVLAMMTVYFWAIIPATLLLIAYLGLMVFNALERRSRGTRIASAQNMSPAAIQEDTEAEAATARPPDPTAPAWKRPNIRMALVKHETILLGGIIVVALITSAVLATILFDWRIAIVAIPFVAAYMLLLSSPVWFAAIEDEAEGIDQLSNGKLSN